MLSRVRIAAFFREEIARASGGTTKEPVVAGFLDYSLMVFEKALIFASLITAVRWAIPIFWLNDSEAINRASLFVSWCHDHWIGIIPIFAVLSYRLIVLLILKLLKIREAGTVKFDPSDLQRDNPAVRETPPGFEY